MDTQVGKLVGADLTQNGGVGVGLEGSSQSVIICRSAITGTMKAPMLVEAMNTQDIGDGLLWLTKANATVDSLTVEQSSRIGILIDGDAAGSLSKVTLKGGDENKGVVQQIAGPATVTLVESPGVALNVVPPSTYLVPLAPTMPAQTL